MAHPFDCYRTSRRSFSGCKIDGQGFILEPAEARAWIAENPRNAEILFPYLNGEDLNSRQDGSASRWVIDFNDRTEEEAKKYRLPYGRALDLVKPWRAHSRERRLREIWWRFKRNAPALRKAIAGLDEVLAITIVSKTVMPMRVRTRQVFSHALAVFATNSYADQAVLSSSLHQMWAIKYGSGMRNDPRYTPSDVFETFARPKPTSCLAEVGNTLDKDRREIMLRRELGLTKLYNLVNDPNYTDGDIERIREIHVKSTRL